VASKQDFSVECDVPSQLFSYSARFKIYLCRKAQNMPVEFFLNNQQDALITPILFSYKILHVSDIFSAHHQEFSTVHSALVSFMQVSDDCFQAESG
jgi:hypothetical protein